MIRSGVVVAVGLLVTIEWAIAQDTAGGLAECQQETTDAARLACYDRKLAELSADPSALETPDAQVTENPAPPADAASSAAESTVEAAIVDEFGMNARVKEDSETAAEALDEIRAVIVSIDEKRYGKRVITLDNGQVWIEETGTDSVRLEPGDEVRIKAGSLGSFKLFGANRRSTRVERVK